MLLRHVFCIFCLALNMKVDGSEPKETCRQRILAKYPKAKCVDVDQISECKKECEHLGEKQCQGKRGEIRKLNCKHETGKKTVTCCCE